MNLWVERLAFDPKKSSGGCSPSGEGEGEGEGAIAVAADTDGVTVLGSIGELAVVDGLPIVPGAFVARFDNDGTLSWVESCAEGPADIALDAERALVLAGFGRGRVSFAGARSTPRAARGTRGSSALRIDLGSVTETAWARAKRDLVAVTGAQAHPSPTAA